MTKLIKYSDLPFLMFRLTVQRSPNIQLAFLHIVFQFQGCGSMVAMADGLADATNQKLDQFEGNAACHLQSFPS